MHAHRKDPVRFARRSSSVFVAVLASMTAMSSAHAEETWSGWFSRHLSTAINYYSAPTSAPRSFEGMPPPGAIEARQADLYRRFRAARLLDAKGAIDLAREYSRLYPNGSDGVSEYMRHYWERGLVVPRIEEKQARVAKIYVYAGSGRMSDAFELGADILSANPNDLNTLMALSTIASSDSDTSDLTAKGVAYARRAIALVQADQVPVTLETFIKAKALGKLHVEVGKMLLNSKPSEAAREFYVALRTDSDLRTNPRIYALLAAGYQQGEYMMYGDDLDKGVPGAEAQVEQIATFVLDALARTVFYAQLDRSIDAATLASWRKSITNLYKYLHDGSEAGLPEFIISTTSTKPLPERAVVQTRAVQQK